MNTSMHLISDLDGTWVHPKAGSSALRRLEAHLLGSPGIVLTFATGRGLTSAISILSTRVRRWPDHIITDVGTAIFHRNAHGAWIEDLNYSAWTSSHWEGKLQKLEPLNWLPEGVQLQPGVIGLRRLALRVLPSHSTTRSTKELRTRLATMGVEADVLSTGRCIDILPCGVHKGTAADFLHRSLKLPDPMVACGDSENDLGLLQTAHTAVLMPDGPLCTSSRRHLVRGAFVPHATGPLGILEALQSETLTYSGDLR